MNPLPIGPRSEKQRRLEAARRLVADIENPLRQGIRKFIDLNPSEITRESFADLQEAMLELLEGFRRGSQSMYDLIEHIQHELTPEELLAAHRERTERIREKCAKSMQRWEEIKRQRLGFPPLT